MSTGNLQTHNFRDSIVTTDQKSGQLSFPDLSERGLLTTVILPAFNEDAALPIVLSELYEIIDDSYEVVVVDDGSTDDTAIIASAYPCRLIRHTSNCGKGLAVRTGIRYAQGQNIVIMDADATYPASAIPRIVKELESHDMVRCIRQKNDKNMPKINRVGNHLFDWLLSRIIGLEGGDHLSGLYGIQRKVLEGMEIESDGFDLETEISFKATTRGIKITSFPIRYQERIGKKKLRPFLDGTYIINRILLLVLVYNPTMFFVVPGLLVMLLAIIGAIILSETPLITPYFGLDIHSFILAALGVLGGFQLVSFGIAASLYSVEVGYRPRKWLTVISSTPVRLGAAITGFVFAILETIHIISIAVMWLYQGAGSFTNTRELVSSATILVGGMQLLSAALFISIFAGRIKQKTKAKNLEHKVQEEV